jgi:hypothetical protein
LFVRHAQLPWVDAAKIGKDPVKGLKNTLSFLRVSAGARPPPGLSINPVAALRVLAAKARMPVMRACLDEARADIARQASAGGAAAKAEEEREGGEGPADAA